MDSGLSWDPGGGAARGRVFTLAWKFPGQQLMECPGITGGTQSGHQGPDSVTHR